MSSLQPHLSDDIHLNACEVVLFQIGWCSKIYITYGKNIRQVTPFAMCILCEPRYVINLKMNQLNIFKTVLLYILLHVPFERVVTLPIWMTSFFGGHNCHTVQRKDI